MKKIFMMMSFLLFSFLFHAKPVCADARLVTVNTFTEGLGKIFEAYKVTISDTILKTMETPAAKIAYIKSLASNLPCVDESGGNEPNECLDRVRGALSANVDALQNVRYVIKGVPVSQNLAVAFGKAGVPGYVKKKNEASVRRQANVRRGTRTKRYITACGGSTFYIKLLDMQGTGDDKYPLKIRVYGYGVGVDTLDMSCYDDIKEEFYRQLELAMKGMVKKLRAPIIERLRKRGASEEFINKVFQKNVGTITLSVSGIADKVEWNIWKKRAQIGVLASKVFNRAFSGFRADEGERLIRDRYGSGVIVQKFNRHVSTKGKKTGYNRAFEVQVLAQLSVGDKAFLPLLDLMYDVNKMKNDMKKGGGAPVDSNKIEKLERRLAELEGRVNTNSGRLDQLKSSVDELRRVVEELKQAKGEDGKDGRTFQFEPYIGGRSSYLARLGRMPTFFFGGFRLRYQFLKLYPMFFSVGVDIGPGISDGATLALTFGLHGLIFKSPSKGFSVLEWSLTGGIMQLNTKWSETKGESGQVLSRQFTETAASLWFIGAGMRWYPFAAFLSEEWMSRFYVQGSLSFGIAHLADQGADTFTLIPQVGVGYSF